MRAPDSPRQLGPPFPKIAALLTDAEDDVLAFYAYPCRTGQSALN